jgi:hypothetical protein
VPPYTGMVRGRHIGDHGRGPFLVSDLVSARIP